MQRTLASLILFLAASPLWAQIELAPEHRLGQRIVATTPFEAKVYDWSSATADVEGDGTKARIWAREGKHTITLIAVTEGYELKRWEKTFEVSDAPQPPTPATLRELVSDSEAKLIAEFYRDFAANIQFVTPDNFWPVHDAKFPVKGNEKLNAGLRKRLEPAVEKKTGLSVELRAIADEFDKEGPEPPKPPVVEPTEKATAAVYIHEKDQSAVPTGVTVGLNRLNREKGITATLFEDDTKDGDGDVPEQYKAPLEAARQAGLPAFVVMAGNKVLRVVKNPQGELEVWEAVP